MVRARGRVQAKTQRANRRGWSVWLGERHFLVAAGQTTACAPRGSAHLHGFSWNAEGVGVGVGVGV
jgi:hypothetical protein